MERARVRCRPAGLVAVWLALGSAVMLLGFACSPSAAPASNLTGEQKARLRELADGIERGGNLRPVLPDYLPRGLDPFPTVLSKFEARVWLVFGSARAHDNTTAPVPVELEVTEELDPGAPPRGCSADPPLEDSALDELGIECVRLDGQVADLEVIEQGEGVVDYVLTFDLRDINTFMVLTWQAGAQPSEEEHAAMRRETLRVAESMISD
jgi:hypothetical protein